MANLQQKHDALVALIEPICIAHGVELVDVAHNGSGRQGGIVRVMIDRPPTTDGARFGSGVTLSDCQGVSRDVSAVLDLHGDLIKGSFHLEVTSPGLDRPLVKVRDYQRFLGEEVTVQTFAPVGERRKFQGVLSGVEDERIAIEVEGERVEVPLENIAKANLVANLSQSKSKSK